MLVPYLLNLVCLLFLGKLKKIQGFRGFIPSSPTSPPNPAIAVWGIIDFWPFHGHHHFVVASPAKRTFEWKIHFSSKFSQVDFEAKPRH